MSGDVYDRGADVAFKRVLDCYFRARRDKSSSGVETLLVYLLADLERGYVKIAKRDDPRNDSMPTFEQLIRAAHNIYEGDSTVQ